LLFKTDREWVADNEQLGKLSDSQSRVLRGGSFNFFALSVRSADRSINRPVDRYSNGGFRVARTYP
jgi:formylglycine-generating enzyme required for sulfatase activity